MHVDIAGSEEIAFSDYYLEKIHKEYDERGDFALQSGEVTVRCKIDSKHFAICMLDGPHMPCLREDDRAEIKKVIFKILV